MTIQALPPVWAAPMKATSAAAASESTDRYLPAEEGTLPRQQPEMLDRLAATRVLQQAGLSDVHCVVSWMGAAVPEGTRLEDFARRTLTGVRNLTSDLDTGVNDLIGLAETVRRAELQTSPETCLEQGLTALGLTYGPLERDPERCCEFRGLLAVVGDPSITYGLLTDALPGPLDREAVIHEVVRGLRERHAEGQPVSAESVQQLREETIMTFMGGPSNR